MLADAEALLGEVVEQVHKLAYTEIRKHDPNHMILGCYVKDWTYTREIWERVAPFVSVLAPQNLSAVTPIKPIVQALGMPAVLGDQEFGNVYALPLQGQNATPGAVPDHVDRRVLYNLLANRIACDPDFIGVSFCACLFDQSHWKSSYDRGQPGFSVQQWDFFQEHGYLIVENVLSVQRLAALREALEKRYDLEGEKAGSEGATPPGVRRLCNLIGKGRVLEELAIEPIALEMARLAIGEDMRWQAMNFHDPMPGDPRPHQAIHADRSFFKNCTAYLNVVWALDDMTEENGATRLVPGSHKKPWPRDVLDDPKEAVAGEIYVTCKAGTGIFCHGDVWHGARANRSKSPRRVIHMGYSCPNTAPQYEIAGSLTQDIRERLGEHCALIPDPLASFGLEKP